MENTDFCGSWCVALTCHTKFILPPWQPARSLPCSSSVGQQGTYKLVFTIDKTEKQKSTLNSRTTFRVMTGSLQEGGGWQWRGTHGRDTAHRAGVRGGSHSSDSPTDFYSAFHMKPNSRFPCSPIFGIWQEFKTPYSRQLGEYLGKHTPQQGEQCECNPSCAGAREAAS